MLEALKGKFGRDKKPNTLVGKTVQVGPHVVKVEGLLGEGGFACIYKVKEQKEHYEFALKHMRLSGDHDAINEVKHEAKTMAQLKGHPNILRLHAVAFGGPQGGETDGFMLMDYCPRTLITHMQECGHLVDDKTLIDVFSDVCKAVLHMHQQNPPICHRDLKVENVLQLASGRWVICDFGSATTRAKVYETQAEIAEEENNIRRATTPAYRAPEMWDLYSRTFIGTKVDIWALGVMLFVLAFGKLPFAGDSRLQVLYGKYDMPATPVRTPELRAFVKELLSVDPAHRPDITAVITKFEAVTQSIRAPQAAEPHVNGLYPQVMTAPPHPTSPPHVPSPAPLPRAVHAAPAAPPAPPAPPLPIAPVQAPATAAAVHERARESFFDISDRPNLSGRSDTSQGASAALASSMYPTPMYNNSPQSTPGRVPSPSPSTTSDAFGDSTNWASFPDPPPQEQATQGRWAAPPAATPATVPAPAPQPAPVLHHLTPSHSTTTITAAPAASISREASYDGLAVFKEEVRGDLDAIRRQLKEVMEVNQVLSSRVRHLEDVVSTQRTLMSRMQLELHTTQRPHSHRDSADGYGLLDGSPHQSGGGLLIDTGAAVGYLPHHHSSGTDYPLVDVGEEQGRPGRTQPQELL